MIWCNHFLARNRDHGKSHFMWCLKSYCVIYYQTEKKWRTWCTFSLRNLWQIKERYVSLVIFTSWLLSKSKLPSKLNFDGVIISIADINNVLITFIFDSNKLVYCCLSNVVLQKAMTLYSQSIKNISASFQHCTGSWTFLPVLICRLRTSELFISPCLKVKRYLNW